MLGINRAQTWSAAFPSGQQTQQNLGRGEIACPLDLFVFSSPFPPTIPARPSSCLIVLKKIGIPALGRPPRKPLPVPSRGPTFQGSHLALARRDAAVAMHDQPPDSNQLLGGAIARAAWSTLSGPTPSSRLPSPASVLRQRS